MLGLLYLQPPNYFQKEKREEAHCVRGTEGNPEVSLARKTQRNRSEVDLRREVVQGQQNMTIKVNKIKWVGLNRKKKVERWQGRLKKNPTFLCKKKKKKRKAS